jgi:MFS family permease
MGKAGLGLLLGVMGGGGILGAWLLARLERRGLPRHLALPMCTGLFAIGIGLVAVAQTQWLALLGMSIGGVFWIWMVTLTNTAVQLTSPPALLGRMLGLYQLAVIGPIALGSFAAGAIAELIGIGWSLAICAALLALFGTLGFVRPVVEIDRPRAVDGVHLAP